MNFLKVIDLWKMITTDNTEDFVLYLRVMTETTMAEEAQWDSGHSQMGP